MASIRIKRSTTAGVVPTTLQPGELAANTADRRLWVGDGAQTPVELAAKPPSVLRAVLDGYALHAWNNPRLWATYAGALSITVGASGAGQPSGFTRSYVFGAAGAPFYAGGGNPVTVGGATSFPVVTPSGSTKVGRHWRVTTLLDGTNIAFHLDSDATADGGYRFLVDGRYVSMTGTVSGSGADRWYVLQFGSRSKRVITVEGYGALRFWGAACPDSDTMLTTFPQSSQRIIILGDSDLEAYGVTLKGDAPAAVLSDFLGIQDVWGQGVYGTGFLASNYGNSYPYSYRRADWTGASPDLLVFAHSINDLREGYSVTQIAAAVVAEIQAARAALGPGVPLLITGYFANLEVAEAQQAGATAALAASENAAYDAVAALDDPLVSYSRAVSAGVPMPVVGLPGQGNFDLYINSSTGHATPAGYVAGGLLNSSGTAQACAALLGVRAPLPMPSLSGS
jgi:hypothetical protein